MPGITNWEVGFCEVSTGFAPGQFGAFHQLIENVSGDFNIAYLIVLDNEAHLLAVRLATGQAASEIIQARSRVCKQCRMNLLNIQKKDRVTIRLANKFTDSGVYRCLLFLGMEEKKEDENSGDELKGENL